ncbi:SpvB/TcaC N-terminal domain-containing protein, partial [Leptospira sp. GIMC2001]|uniref:SpvB/TcaC N-terminal domain-containing protein n=1 Tax=Leptospira sp. GIMC2001 TaxID=1513297 RepID=UPI00234A73E3
MKIINDKILSRIISYGITFFLFASIGLAFNFFSSTAPLPQAMPESSVDANGNLTMAFPLEIPEGTSGMTPQISLSYHSQGGSASIGKGWVLSGLPEIRRDADLDSYKEQKYSHSYNGSLFHINGTGKYGFRSENFARLEPQGNSNNPASWIERSADGDWKVYGDGADHTIASMDSAENWVWAIKSEQDVLGNEIKYEYYKNDGNLLPKEIIYANGRRTIEFSYEDFSDDKISYVLRNQRKETKILSEIRFYTDGSKSHSYDFTYDIDNTRNVFSLNSILYKADSYTNTHIPISFQKTGKPRGFLDQFGTQDIQTNGYGVLIDTVDRLFELVKQILFQKMMSQVQAGAKRGNMNSFERSATANFNGTISTLSGTSATNATGRFPKNLQSGLKRSIAPYTSLGEIYLNIAQDAVAPPSNPPTNNDHEFQNMSTEGVGRYPIKDRKTCDWGVIACVCAAVVPGCHTEVINYCGQFLFFGGFDSCQNGINAPIAMVIPTDINGDGITEYSRLLGRMDASMALHVHDETGAFGDTVLPNLPIRYNTYMDVADIDGDGRTDFVYAFGGKLHVAFSEGTYLSSPLVFHHVALKDMPLIFTRVDEYKPSDFLMDWNRDGRTDFVHVEGKYVNVYLSTGRNFATKKTYDLTGLEPIEIITKDENPTSSHRLSGFADMDGDGNLEHVMMRPSPVGGFNSILDQINAENKLELEQKQAEFAPQKNQLLGILSNPANYSGGQIAETRGQLRESDRETYDQFIAGEVEMDTALEQTFIASFDAFFIGPKIENLVNDQRIRLEEEQNRLADLKIEFNSFVAVVTYFSPNGVAVRQETQDINTLGLAGMNWLLDVNGDGLPDLVSLTNHLSKANPFSMDDNFNEILKLIDVELIVRLNEGGRFSSTATATAISSGFAKNSGGYQLADVNLDGEVDFLVPTGVHGRDYEIYLGNGLGNFTHLSGIKLTLPIDADVKSLRMEDRNGDGVPDMHIQYGRDFKTRVVTSVRDYPEGLITQITDGNGGSTQINYSWKKDMAGTVVEANRSYVNGVPNYGAQVLVQSVTRQASPDLAVSTKSFSYSNQRYKMGDEITSANLGFETVTETHSLNGNTEAIVTTRYSQNPNYAGTVSWQEVRDSQNVLVSRTDMSYAIYYPTAISKLVLPTSTTSLSYVNGQLKDTKTTTTTYNPNYAYSPATLTENWNGRITTQETYYASEPGLGILAEPIEEITKINGELVSHVTRSFANGNITSESKLVEPGKWYAQYFTYDTTGNVITQTDSLGRTLQYTYGGTNGNLPITATNAIGQTTSKEYDPITDLETKSTDANGNITTMNYDKYGRTTESSFNGNKVQSIYYEYAGSLMTTTTVTHSTSGDSWTKAVTDKEGKTRLTESLVNAGITSTEETKYDNKGRAIQKSHAYLTGETPTWTTTEYYPVTEDNLQRPKRITANTGEITEIVYSLNSTNITISKDSEVIRTETATSDNFGQLQYKTVQGKTIQYTYNNKGQLVQVIDPGNSNTTMTYDLGGRK